jgi:NADH:ubiquinone oxidoreductase subunit 2 (subunit N)
VNAPLIFLLFPTAASLPAYGLYSRRPRLVAFGAALLSLFLSWLALALPLDAPLSVWNASIPVSHTLPLFGRSFTFLNSMRPALFFLSFGAAAMYGGSAAVGQYRRIVPVGLVVQALLTASLFIQPFLYAALFLLLSVAGLSMLLSDSSHPEPRGAVRWIAFTALAVPFLLLAGTELSYRSGLPLDAARAQPIIVLLSLGFALLLAVPPFHFWLPDVADDSPPYSVSLILTLYIGAVVFFLLRFLDEFSWLRTSAEMYSILQSGGAVLCVVGGVLALAQERFGRMIGYLSMVNLGAILLALSTRTPDGVETAVVLLATRGFSLIVWGIAFHVLRARQADDRIDMLRGKAALFPFSCVAAVLSGLSLSGIPGLISFPGYWSTLRILSSGSEAGISLPMVLLLACMATGVLSCLRFARVMLESPLGLPFPPEGGRLHRLILGFSIILFFLLGFLPQLYLPWLANSAQAFSNLMVIQ